MHLSFLIKWATVSSFASLLDYLFFWCLISWILYIFFSSQVAFVKDVVTVMEKVIGFFCMWQYHICLSLVLFPKLHWSPVGKFFAYAYLNGVSSLFLSSSFNISGLIVRFLVWFELFFVQGQRRVSVFPIQLIQHHEDATFSSAWSFGTLPNIRLIKSFTSQWSYPSLGAHSSLDSCPSLWPHWRPKAEFGLRQLK